MSTEQTLRIKLARNSLLSLEMEYPIHLKQEVTDVGSSFEPDFDRKIILQQRKCE
jgi:hypothetical protein